MEIVGIIGTIVVAIAIAVVIGVWIYLKKRSKPTYETTHGCLIWCQQCKFMKNRKIDVENETARVIRLVSPKFGEQVVTKAVKGLLITFKDKLFKPEGPVNSTAKLLSGVYQPDKNRMVVCVQTGKTLPETAFAHEMLHHFMYVIDGISGDSDNVDKYKEYWDLLKK